MYGHNLMTSSMDRFDGPASHIVAASLIIPTIHLTMGKLGQVVVVLVVVVAAVFSNPTCVLIFVIFLYIYLPPPRLDQ